MSSILIIIMSSFCIKSLKTSVHFTLISHFELDTIQLLKSHMWLVAVILDSAHIFFFHAKKTVHGEKLPSNLEIKFKI